MTCFGERFADDVSERLGDERRAVPADELTDAEIAADLLTMLHTMSERLAAVSSTVGMLSDSEQLWSLVETIRGRADDPEDKGLRGDLSAVEDEIVRLLHVGIGEGHGFNLSDGRRIVAGRAKSSERVDGKRLLSLVAARKADDFFGQPPAVFAVEVAEEVSACAGLHRESHKWSKTELRKRGIKPDDFITSEPGRMTITEVRG